MKKLIVFSVFLFIGFNIFMANFNNVIVQPLKNEGGYSNNPHDSGGETYRGISRNNFPKWEGWKLVDAAKPLKNEEIIKNDSLDHMVLNFYKQVFFYPNKLDKVNSNEIAQKILDMAINMGSYRAIKLTQKALVFCGVHVDQDGKIGPETLRGINSLSEFDLHEALRKVSIEFYNELIAKKPSQKVFYNIWMNRAKQ